MKQITCIVLYKYNINNMYCTITMHKTLTGWEQACDMAMGLWGLLTSMMTGASSSTNHKHLRKKEGDFVVGGGSTGPLQAL